MSNLYLNLIVDILLDCLIKIELMRCMSQTKPLDMEIYNVDAFIFFVNESLPNAGAYAFFPFIIDIGIFNKNQIR